AHDVRLEDRLPRTFDGEAAEVDDGIHALGDDQRVLHAGNVALNELLAVSERLDGLQVRDAQRIAPGELAPQVRSDAARRTGDENGFQAGPFRRSPGEVCPRNLYDELPARASQRRDSQRRGGAR